jgi:hypothetical protein
MIFTNINKMANKNFDDLINVAVLEKQQAEELFLLTENKESLNRSISAN